MSSRGAFSKPRFFHIRAGAQAGQVVAVDGIHHLVQAAFERLPVRRILVGGFQHQVDGGVEFLARLS